MESIELESVPLGTRSAWAKQARNNEHSEGLGSAIDDGELRLAEVDLEQTIASLSDIIERGGTPENLTDYANLQIAMHLLGYDTGPIDGVYGSSDQLQARRSARQAGSLDEFIDSDKASRTMKAFAALQKEEGLTVDAVAGENTIGKIITLLADKKKRDAANETDNQAPSIPSEDTAPAEGADLPGTALVEPREFSEEELSFARRVPLGTRVGWGKKATGPLREELAPATENGELILAKVDLKQVITHLEDILSRGGTPENPEDYMKLQIGLHLMGYDPGIIDGIYASTTQLQDRRAARQSGNLAAFLESDKASNTMKAFAAIQEDSGLRVDGFAGKNTIGIMVARLTEIDNSPPPVVDIQAPLGGVAPTWTEDSFVSPEARLPPDRVLRTPDPARLSLPEIPRDSLPTLDNPPAPLTRAPRPPRVIREPRAPRGD